MSLEMNSDSCTGNKTMIQETLSDPQESPSASEKKDTISELSSRDCEKPKDESKVTDSGGDFNSNLGASHVKEVKLEMGFPPTEKLDDEYSMVVEMGREVLLEAKKKQLLEQIESFEINPRILLGVKGIEESFQHQVMVEVIDDTALIRSPAMPRKYNVGTNVDDRKVSKIGRQEFDGKKAKGLRRNKKKAIDTLEINTAPTETSHVKVMDGEMKHDQLNYSREEMEALRFVNVVEQRKMWGLICTGLGDAVMTEYNDLARSNSLKNNGFNFDPRPSFARKDDAPGILGEVSSGNMNNGLGNLENKTGNVNHFNLDDCLKTGDEDTNMVWEDGFSEEEDSDEEYASIQKPAFVVEGEPDSDSGPPENGWEYLRRVRWEAAHIPKVKVAKLDRNKLNKEQSVYMPQIPEIEKCPEHLLPIKQWEEEFLADFAKLGLSLASNKTSNLKITPKQQAIVIGHRENISLPKHNAVSSIFETLKGDGIQFCTAVDDFSIENVKEEQTMADSVGDTSSCYPTMSAILAMDPVTRVSKLQKRISLVETLPTLSKSDCVWIFVLCATVDTPLDADTCAALRSLLRKCASLRAGKSEVDNEVIMLNILITISGKYFGQSEN